MESVATVKGAGRVRPAAPAARFRSPDEAREVIGRTLELVSSDDRIGPMLRAAGLRERLRFPDLDLGVEIEAVDEADRYLAWSFTPRSSFDPELALEMDSEVGNRYLQGRESIAIAIARGRISLDGDARSALLMLPATRLIARRYAELIERDYPHLLV